MGKLIGILLGIVVFLIFLAIKSFIELDKAEKFHKSIKDKDAEL